MNIFYLDHCPFKAATYLVDSHVVVMAKESKQMLSAAHYVCGSWQEGMSKPAYLNHPCAIWCRASEANYRWLHAHYCAIGLEYTRRYGKTHGAMDAKALLYKPPLMVKLKEAPFTQPTQAMPDEYKVPGNSVIAYRNYYSRGKRHLHSWRTRLTPDWIKDHEQDR